MRYSTAHARVFQFRVSQFLLLAVLAAGIVASSPRVAAQAAASAADGQAAASAPAATQPKAHPTEEEQTKAFRLEGPMVKATAKALHLSAETTARLYEGINFAILFLALGIPLFRILPKMLRGRREKLNSDIEAARKVTEAANAQLSAVDAKLSRLGEEIARFRADVEQEIGREEVRIKASLEEESARIVAAAEQEIGVAAAQAKRELRHFAADLAIDQAAKQLVLTPETDRALLAEFLGGVGKNGSGRGGQK